MSWKDRLPWLLLAALWLESALFHSYLSSAIPLFPVFVTLPQGWSVWIPPLVVALLYITLGRMFAKKSWLPWTLTTLSSVYILADIVIFSTHLGQHAESLWFRFSGAVTVLLLFIFAVTQKNVREEGLSFSNTKFISDEDHAKFYKRSNVARGDILISMIGANRGMACLVDDERVFSIKNVGLVKENSSVNQRLLLYFLKSSQAAEYVSSKSKGGAQEFIGLTELRKFPVAIPELSEQGALVAKLDALSEETQRLESLYQRKLAALNELKKSLLHQAFSGAL